MKRWALRLHGYNFDIKYVNTTNFDQANALSRLINKTKVNADSEIDENTR